MIEYVCGFAFNAHYRHVALIQKEKPEWQKGLLNGIGGKVEVGETVSEAMEREFEEEAGINISKDKWKYFASIQGVDWKVYFFETVTQDIKNIISKTSEIVGLYPVNTIQALDTIPNLKWLIPMCLDSNHNFARSTALN